MVVQPGNDGATGGIEDVLTSDWFEAGRNGLDPTAHADVHAPAVE
jgi:hypothetical protein